MHRTLFIALLAVVTGCRAAHATLRPVPEPSAPISERLRAYQDLAPGGAQGTRYFRNGIETGVSLDAVILGDGTRVENPADLLPAVSDTSPTAKYAKSFTEHSDRTSLWGGVGGLGLLAGLAAGVISLALPSDSGPLTSTPRFAGVIVSGSISVLSIVPLYVSMVEGNHANQDRMSAFQTYPQSLQQRLGLEDPPEKAPSSPSPTSADLPSDAPTALKLAVY